MTLRLETEADADRDYALLLARVAARAREAGVPEEDVEAFLAAWERSRAR